ncbi:MAG TPA: hypothetical protein VHM28_04760, partial [Anaerolineales bacterium]|nr:hypothetical protein [Anaerolineales bacterium]
MKTENTDSHPDYSYDFLWLSLGLLPLLLIALLLPATTYDYWWYLRLGHDILQAGHVPTVETYSFTHVGEPIINQPWLSAVMMWLAYSNSGMDAVFLLRFLCIGLAYGFIWIWMRQLGAGPRLASILIVLAGAAGSNNWSLRPQMFAYPLFALTLFLLWKWHKENSKFVWFMPLVGLAWANLHDSFLIVFILMGAALIFGQGNRRNLVFVILASFIAMLVTPFGITLWVSLIHSLISPLSWNLSTEWQPPRNAGWQMNIFFGWVLLFLPLSSFSSRRLSLLEWVWLLGLLWMSFSGIRYVIWGLFVLAAFSAALLAEWDLRWLDRPTQTVRPAFNYFLGAMLLLVSLLALPGIR